MQRGDSKWALPRKLRHHRVLLVASVALVAVVYVGCASVPDIRFVNDATETGADTGAGDGPTTDGSKDGSSGHDATTTCTSPSPGGGAACCGQVWCIGDCSGTNCDLCAASCQSGEFCCGKMGNVMCKPRCP